MALVLAEVLPTGEVVVRGEEDVWDLHLWENGAHGELATADSSLTPVSHRAASAPGAGALWLVLTPVEAFHLAYVQGRMRIAHGLQQQHAGRKRGAAGEDGLDGGSGGGGSTEVLDQLACWLLFRGAEARFPYDFAAYCHLVADGWLVRSGLQFGADFSLYALGPRLEHASHLVLIHVEGEPPRSWISLQGHVRLSQQVNKKLVLCQVTLAQPGAAEPGAEPGCDAAAEGAGETLLDRVTSTPAVCLDSLRVSLTQVGVWSPGRAHGEESYRVPGGVDEMWR